MLVLGWLGIGLVWWLVVGLGCVCFSDLLVSFLVGCLGLLLGLVGLLVVLIGCGFSLGWW